MGDLFRCREEEMSLIMENKKNRTVKFLWIFPSPNSKGYAVCPKQLREIHLWGLKSTLAYWCRPYLSCDLKRRSRNVLNRTRSVAKWKHLFEGLHGTEAFLLKDRWFRCICGTILLKVNVGQINTIRFRLKKNH